MDTSAHRTIKQARDLLVDGLGLATVVPVGTSDEEIARLIGHGFTASQLVDLTRAASILWSVMTQDPAPPECQTCATPLIQPATGRPRRYCSAACRQADFRDRQP